MTVSLRGLVLREADDSLPRCFRIRLPSVLLVKWLNLGAPATTLFTGNRDRALVDHFVGRDWLMQQIGELAPE